jgi:hypothetical protein
LKLEITSHNLLLDLLGISKRAQSMLIFPNCPINILLVKFRPFSNIWFLGYVLSTSPRLEEGLAGGTRIKALHTGQTDWDFFGDFLYFSSVNSTSLLSIKVNSTKISNYFATTDFSKKLFLWIQSYSTELFPIRIF